MPTRPPKTLTWPIEVTLDMQIRAELLQRTLGGGGDGGFFSGAAKFIVSLPMVICVAVWWSLVRFRRAIFFCFFLANLLFLGADGRATRDFGPPKTAIVGHISIGLKNMSTRQKPRS